MIDYQQPDARGHFGPYGGTFVAETLVHALDELNAAYEHYRNDPEFQAEFRRELKHFVGRPSPMYHAARTSRELGGAQIYLKREDLNHTGAHKVNNTIGQALLAKRMGKPRVIAETGAGQHGVATATICARYGMECVVYMGAEDVKRQSPNVYRMHLLGATVVPVESGSKTLKDALNEALRDWVTNVENTFYIIGTVAGPHPYPAMVRDFQRVIGDECLVQMPEMIGRQPDAVIACVGGGSNAMGIFYPYIPDESVRLIGVEAAGEGLDTGKHAASLSAGSPGVLHGNRTYLLQDENGQIIETHSVSAGLDYPGVGPRARLPQGHRPRRVRRHHRCRGPEGLSPPVPNRGHHSRARIQPRAGLCHEARAHDASGPASARQSVWPRGQGHRYRGRSVGRGVLLPPVMPRANRQGAGHRGGGAAMSRIQPTFSRLQAQGRKALIPFIHAGDPDPALTADIMLGMAAAGADVIELGVPFSDPMADGPVIQRAAERALAKGIGLTQVLAYVRAFRSKNGETPVVLMGYANPVERYDQRHGAGAFVKDSAAAGVDGVLIVDYPPEECESFAAQLKAAGLDPIFLLAPTSTEQRMREVGRIASGYVYYVSLKGVTGAGHLDTGAVAAMVPRIKAHVHVPVGVGFGIRDAHTAKAVAAVSDAVVIGSALVQLMESQPSEQVVGAASAFIAEIRSALDQEKGAPE